VDAGNVVKVFLEIAAAPEERAQCQQDCKDCQNAPAGEASFQLPAINDHFSLAY
jgi:hypothetical protein